MENYGYPLANFEISLKLDQLNDEIKFSLKLKCKDKGCLNANINGSILSELFLTIFLEEKNISGTRVKAVLKESHNVATHNGFGLSHLNDKLEGGIYAIICILFSHVQMMDVINKNALIALQISNNNVRSFYSIMGFVDLDQNYMIVKLSDLISICKNKKMSEDLLEIVDSF